METNNNANIFTCSNQEHFPRLVAAREALAAAEAALDNFFQDWEELGVACDASWDALREGRPQGDIEAACAAYDALRATRADEERALTQAVVGAANWVAQLEEANRKYPMAWWTYGPGAPGSDATRRTVPVVVGHIDDLKPGEDPRPSTNHDPVFEAPGGTNFILVLSGTSYDCWCKDPEGGWIVRWHATNPDWGKR